MATCLQCKQQYQRHKILQVFQPSGTIRKALPYYRTWHIFDGWDARIKKRGQRCGSDVRSFATNGVDATAEEDYRGRPLRGVYVDNITAQKSCLDVSSYPNEWSQSWEMSKPINTTRITINDNGVTTRPLCQEKRKLTAKGKIGKSIRAKNLKMNENDMKIWILNIKYSKKI